MRHRLSIITINYNDKNGLEKTIKSVINQSCRDYEFIVVDGGSNDGSADIIKNHTDYIDKWVSEPDKGIYNAMNKGALMASGDYITYLNSGDEFHDQDVTRDIISHLDRETDIIFGNVLNVHRGGTYKHLQIHKTDFTNVLISFSGEPLRSFHLTPTTIKKTIQ